MRFADEGSAAFGDLGRSPFLTTKDTKDTKEDTKENRSASRRTQPFAMTLNFVSFVSFVVNIKPERGFFVSRTRTAPGSRLSALLRPG